MNKQVEQIRAEIERRLRLLEHGDADIEVMKRVEGVIKGYKAVLSFIDSIPEEPVSEDLDKAIEDAMPGVPAWHIDEVGDDTYENAYNSIQMADMFKAGADWQKMQDVRDMLKSDETNFVKCYERGKADMKEQMMKDAIEAEVNYYGIGDKEMCVVANEEVDGEKYNLHDGDKVKLIIVKED